MTKKHTSGGRNLLVSVLVLALVLTAVLGACSPAPVDPKQAVKDAQTKTNESLIAMQTRAGADIPALADMIAVPAPSQGNISIIFDGFTGIEGAETYSAMFAGSGISVDYAADPDTTTAELNFDIVFAGSDLLKGYAYLSPDLIAANIPEFTDTIAAIAPKTIAEDYKASSLYAGEDESVEIVQNMLNSYIGLFANIKQMQTELIADIQALIDPVMDAAEYESLPDQDGNKVYQVTLLPAAVRELVLSYYNYIFNDSAFSEFFSSIPEFTSVKETAITEIESSIPDMNVVLVYTINRDGIITAISATGKVLDETGAEVDGGVLTAEMTYDGSSAYTVVMDCTIPDTAEGATTLNMDVGVTYAGEEYSVGGTYSVSVPETMDMTVPFNMTFTKTGIVGGYATNVQTPYSGSMNTDITFDGTVTADGDTTTYNIPLVVTVSGDGIPEAVVINMHTDSISAPLTDAVTAPANAVNIFTMTEAELMALAAEYQAGFEQLTSSFLG